MCVIWGENRNTFQSFVTKDDTTVNMLTHTMWVMHIVTIFYMDYVLILTTTIILVL